LLYEIKTEAFMPVFYMKIHVLLYKNVFPLDRHLNEFEHPYAMHADATNTYNVFRFIVWQNVIFGVYNKIYFLCY